MKKYLFVGERRSPTAIRMNVTWVDKRLAAGHLYKALKNLDICWDECAFANVFEDKIEDILSFKGVWLLQWAEKLKENSKNTKYNTNLFIIPQLVER